MATVGDNSIAADALKLFLERIEKLEDEKQFIADDIKDVYTEVKAQGFDTKTVRKLVSLRRIDRDKRVEAQMLLETYATAIGLDLI